MPSATLAGRCAMARAVSSGEPMLRLQPRRAERRGIGGVGMGRRYLVHRLADFGELVE